MENNYYTKNLETGRIELTCLSKEDYMKIKQIESKAKEFRYYFQWGKNSGNVWISRRKYPNLYAVEEYVKEKLGFTNKVEVGKKLSYVEQMENKKNKAVRRSERYEYKANKLNKEGDERTKEFNENNDWSYWSQPKIDTSAGRAFTKRRQKVVANFDKGMQLKQDAAYYSDKANVSKYNSEQNKFTDKSYLQNKIDECKSILRKNITNEYREEIEDKLNFFKDKIAELGGVEYNKDNIFKGDIVKIKGMTFEVYKSNPKNVRVFSNIYKGHTLSYKYAQIQEVIKRSDNNGKTSNI